MSALYDAKQKHEVVGAISFDYGSKHNHKEIPFAAYHSQKVSTSSTKSSIWISSVICSNQTC